MHIDKTLSAGTGGDISYQAKRCANIFENTPQHGNVLELATRTFSLF
jgi:hypothetical protein